MITLLTVLMAATSVSDSLLARASFNRPAWESAVGRLEGIERERCAWLLAELGELDLMETDEATIIAHVKACSRSLALRRGYAVAEDTIRAFVLHPLTGYYDMLTEWRSELLGLFDDQCTGSVPRDTEIVLSYLRESVRVESRSDAFAPPSPPVGTLRRGWGSDHEWASLAVAGLRSVGIPARLACEGNGVEVWDGRWSRVHSPDDALAANTTADADLAGLRLELTSGGQPWRAAEHVGLSRWRKGAWRPAEPPETCLEIAMTDTTFLVSAPPGRYLFSAGIRNARGEPRVWCTEASLSTDTTLVLTQDLSIPFGDLHRADLVQPPEPLIRGVLLRDTSGAVRAVDAIADSGRSILICAVEFGSERSERILAALNELRPDLEAAGPMLITVHSGSEPIEGAWADHEGSLWRALGIGSADAMPVVTLLSPVEGVMLHQRGASPTAIDLVIQCVARPRTSAE
ncbi:MAG: transglutaminase-like domain-containing protein [Candidatus Eisenbacteria bacterium]|jgi:hypothetical protein|nr:transglutaminase-like domain-containing protein [Candidatus Eisenbacteria bacterium]